MNLFSSRDEDEGDKSNNDENEVKTSMYQHICTRGTLLIQILLSPCQDRVCTKQPIAVEQIASFSVDLTKLENVDDWPLDP